MLTKLSVQNWSKDSTQVLQPSSSPIQFKFKQVDLSAYDAMLEGGEVL